MKERGRRIMGEKVEIHFGDGPNKNGRIYTRECVKKIAEDIKSKQFFVVKEIPSEPQVNLKDVIGEIKSHSVEYDEDKNILKVECRLFGNHEVTQPLVPNGTGKLTETGEVTEYNLVSFSLTPNSAFLTDIGEE